MALPAEDAHPEPVIVFESSDAAALAVAESLLEEAEIEFLAIGEGLQDFFGAGRLSGFNPVVGAVKLQVAAEDAEQARAALRGLPESGS
jgi:hypothetical protein